MNKDKPFVVYKGSQARGKNLENVYVIYTPKIIKFIYPSQHSQLDRSKKVQQNQRLHAANLPSKIKLERPKEIQPKRDKSEKLLKKPKIKLFSRLTTDISSEKNNSSVQSSNYSQPEQKKLKTTRKIKTYSVLQKTNLKTKKNEQSTMIMPSFTCELLGCNEAYDDLRFQAKEKEPQEIQSRVVIVEPLQPPNLAKIQTVGSQMNLKPSLEAKANESFKDRKKIFEKSYISRVKLNKSFDSHINSRSRSRKSIFQHSNIKGRSKAKYQPTSFRQTIFQPNLAKVSALVSFILKEQRFDDIQIGDIPQQIYTKWKQQHPERPVQQEMIKEIEQQTPS